MSAELGTCSTCKFYSNYGKCGVCRRYPPTLQPRKINEISENRGGGYEISVSELYPATSETEWCGEYQSK
jgi:hypothetical protein